MPLLAMALVAATFLGFRAWIASEVRRCALEVIQEDVRRQAETVGRLFDAGYAALEAAAADPDARRMLSALAESTLAEPDAQAEVLFGYADKDGNVTATAAAYAEESAAATTWFSACAAGERAVCLAAGGAAQVLLAVPVYDGDTFAGAAFAAFDRKMLEDVLTAARCEGAHSYLCWPNGGVLFDADGAALPNEVFDIIPASATYEGMSRERVIAAMHNGKEAAFIARGAGRTLYAAFVPLGETEFYYATVAPYAPAESIDRRIGTFSAVMLLAMLLVIAIVSLTTYLQRRRTVARLTRETELLRQSGERYALLNRLSSDVFFTVDLESGELRYNENFEAAFGFLPPVRTLDEIAAGHTSVVESDRPAFQRLLGRMKRGEPGGHEEVRILDAHGQERWQRFEFFTAFGADGKPTQIVGKMTDINRQKRSMQRLMKKAESDSLTGLLNRAAMEQRISEFLALDGRDGLHALLMIDIDNFKAANDTLGHLEGDRMLVQFASSLRQLFRAGDLVGRMGGDEFAVLMKDISSDENALDKASELGEGMAALSREFGARVTASVGVSIYARDGRTFETLYERADAALYRAKNAGRNHYFLYGEKSNAPDGADMGTEA